MADEFKDALLYKVDVDENDETASEVGIQAMPTFKFYKDGQQVIKCNGTLGEWSFITGRVGKLRWGVVIFFSPKERGL